jgi:hypothetical protein
MSGTGSLNIKSHSPFALAVCADPFSLLLFLLFNFAGYAAGLPWRSMEKGLIPQLYF